MKRAFYVLLPALLVAFGGVAFAGIVGSPHDVSGTWGGGEVCLPCHVPHNAMKDGDDSMVLWNHELTTATFDMYSPFSMAEADRGTRDALQPTVGGPSRLCLSCHDGSIAMDNYGGAVGGTNFMPGTPGTPDSSNLGTDLRDDHPIGITYPADDTAGYHNASTLTGVKLVDWGTWTNRLECTSCHDPHDYDTYTPFLREDTALSAICLKCHDK